MKNIAKRPAEDREALFRNTADKMGINEAIIEKDFWVCWMLDYLFHECPWKNNLTFKGGTSLSKAYGLIDRFSEDIDLILDWCILDYEKDEPWKDRTKNRQDHFNKEADRRAEIFLKDLFLPQIRNDLSEELGISVDMGILDNDKQTIIFRYPNGFSDASILQEIRLEIGPLAACTPAGWEMIQPYSAEKYPNLFGQKSTDVLTVHPERTFWEKILILHSVANLPEGKQVPLRYSRHYYDVVRSATWSGDGSPYVAFLQMGGWTQAVMRSVGLMKPGFSAMPLRVFPSSLVILMQVFSRIFEYQIICIIITTLTNKSEMFVAV
ncbi:MAG: nucleotidyl transferase AbiEii/AbiGii toxin family protein [Candidatus Methanomethylophilaceae archaeon]|jgi:hypothetical protein|nr:nucleotidyl transferase AbiEii/AbiGii toxin family protein [Candidatus Methanomethylophilaceae archaeon]MDY0224235.1 nucleotidyl transferase AbiEii/AbiGii toxin family protein [Candidatus Methanomethylophilaceae archaeon]MDY3202108.1 nucleotidyl transferase AbiEii/AbiGii toxin family protein [Methanocorpusculum sp.]